MAAQDLISNLNICGTNLIACNIIPGLPVLFVCFFFRPLAALNPAPASTTLFPMVLFSCWISQRRCSASIPSVIWQRAVWLCCAADRRATAGTASRCGGQRPLTDVCRGQRTLACALAPADRRCPRISRSLTPCYHCLVAAFLVRTPLTRESLSAAHTLRLWHTHRASESNGSAPIGDQRRRLDVSDDCAVAAAHQ